MNSIASQRVHLCAQSKPESQDANRVLVEIRGANHGKATLH